jgi:hypothetical protein
VRGRAARACHDLGRDADELLQAARRTERLVLAFVSGGNITIGTLTSFQGAMYAVNDYTESNNSTVWGPIIARRVSLANSSANHYVPIGTLMPGMPANYEDVVTITNEPGSWG